MALEFRPPFQIDPNRPSRTEQGLANLNQTIAGIGDEFSKYGQNARQQQYQQALLDLQKRQDAREQIKSAAEYGDPNAPDTSTISSASGFPMSMMPGQSNPPSQSPGMSYPNQPDQYTTPGQSAVIGMQSDSANPSGRQGMPLVDKFYNHMASQGTPIGQPTDWNSQAQSAIQRYMDSLNNPHIGMVQRKSMLESAKDIGSIAKDLKTNDAIAPVYSREQALELGKVPTNAKIVEPPNELSMGLKEDQRQDKLEQEGRNQIISMRGDTSIRNIEAQRDAATQAWKTINGALKEGRPLNQFEYYDTLGQLWKARTGASPSDQAIKDLDAKTFQGDIGKALTYFTGNPAGRTTLDSMRALSKFVADTGMNADQLHQGYMTAHMQMPSGLNQERLQRLQKLQRGLSFQEATGYNPSPSNADPDVIAYAKRYGLTVDQAAQIKAQRTGGSK